MLLLLLVPMLAVLKALWKWVALAQGFLLGKQKSRAQSPPGPRAVVSKRPQAQEALVLKRLWSPLLGPHISRGQKAVWGGGGDVFLRA